jgi:hypothetical protein
VRFEYGIAPLAGFCRRTPLPSSHAAIVAEPFRPVVHQAEITRVTGVAAAQRRRRLLDHAHRGTAAPRGDRGAQGRAAAADHQNVDGLRGGRFAHGRVRSIPFRTAFLYSLK